MRAGDSGRTGAIRRRPVAAVILAALISLAAATSAHAIQLGVQDPGLLYPSITPVGTAVLQTTHARWTRELLRWDLVVPGGSASPSGFDASNPADPHYFWVAYDALDREAAQEHLTMIFTIMAAPDWAEGPNRPDYTSVFPGGWDPDVADFAAFAHAAAERYSGHFPDPANPGQNLPRIRYWQIWNEPNLPTALAAPDTVSEYRSLLNSGYAAIKGVDPSDVVGMGGLAPVSSIPPRSISPLTFAAQLMCMQRIKTRFRRVRPCVASHFDFIDEHPYDLAVTPTTHATHYDDLLVADLGKLQTLLKAARKAHTITPGSHPLWVTEWSWFTNPPSALVGDPDRTAARFTAYSMYEMWQAHVNVLIWFGAQDPENASDATVEFVGGSGLYAADGRPKLMLRAFTFPFIASVTRGRGFAWGQIAGAGRRRVTIQRHRGHGWVRVMQVTTRPGGVFTARFRARVQGVYRASARGYQPSLPYNSTPIKPGRTHAGFPH